MELDKIFSVATIVIIILVAGTLFYTIITIDWDEKTPGQVCKEAGGNYEAQKQGFGDWKHLCVKQGKIYEMLKLNKHWGLYPYATKE